MSEFFWLLTLFVYRSSSAYFLSCL